MTMLFWRGLFSGSAVLLFFFVTEGSKALRSLAGLRWPALAVTCLSALGMITGIGSLRYTSVADAMVIYATVPFVTAGLAYLFIGERPSRSTLIASAVALAGVSIMLAGSPWGGSMYRQIPGGDHVAVDGKFHGGHAQAPRGGDAACHGRFRLSVFILLLLVCHDAFGFDL